MKFSDLQKEVLEFRAGFGADSISGTFRPQAYTPRLEQMVSAMEGESAPSTALAKVVSKLIASWDLVQDDGTPAPLTEASLMDVPVSVLGELFRSMASAMVPKATSAANSGAG